jgi:hypothetical protein
MNEFYVLEPVDNYFGTKWAYAEDVDPVNLGSVDRCPVCGDILSLKPWLPPYRAKLSSAKPEKWGDFLWVGGTSLAVSTRFRKIYEREGLRGVESFSGPIEVVRYGTRKTGDFPILPPEYFIIRVPWGGANQDDIASGVTRENPEVIKCLYCRTGWSRQKQPRIIIEDGSWDGSDIFRPRGTPIKYMVSEKFRGVCEKYQVTNVWLIPGMEFGYDEKYPGNWYINKQQRDNLSE